MALRPNRPTPEGRELGQHLGRFCDQAFEKLRARDVTISERCRSCAFRAGSIPNGCPTTGMDALKAVFERVPFLCHETPEPHTICMGWVAMVLTSEGDGFEVAWPFSDEVRSCEVDERG